MYLQAARASIAGERAKLTGADSLSHWKSIGNKHRNRDLTLLMHLKNHPNGQMVVIRGLSSQHEEPNKQKIKSSWLRFWNLPSDPTKKNCSLSSFGNHPELFQSLYLCLLLSRLKNRLPQAPTIRGRSASSALLRNQLGFPAQRTFLLKERQAAMTQQSSSVHVTACHSRPPRTTIVT